MLTSRDIICISTIDWEFIWQGHQQIMSTLAREGNRVLFIENTGVRAPGLRDLPRLKRRVLNWLRGTKGFRQEQDNLFIYSPIILPFPYSPVARRINRHLLLSALRRWMHAVGFRRPLVWTFLPTPLARDLIRELDPELTVYYCIDDFASSSRSARLVRRSETQLFREADLVFVTSEKLRQRAAALNWRTHVFPFGVDVEAFDAVRNRPDGIPEDLDALPKPIVGYVGGLHQWVDQRLLAQVAGRMPEVTFALIGPAQTDTSQLARCPNVRLLGPRRHAEVPRYLKGFDAAIIPYALSDYTAHVYPTKLNEYLAMGLPVVATDLPEVRRFNQAHGGIVRVAPDPERFASALREALERCSAEERERFVGIARANSWASRIEQMRRLIEQEAAVKRAAGWRWEESLRRLYRTARRRLVRLTVGGAVAYLAVFHSPLIWALAAPLRLAQPPRQADAVVVFAGGVGETGRAGGDSGYQERVKAAVDLYQAGMAPRLIFSSGYTGVFHETAVMAELAASLGVPESAIVVESRAANTMENVTHVRDILRARGWRRVLLVSSPYHMRRAMLTFRRLAPDVEVTPTPVAASRFYSRAGGNRIEQFQAVLHEYLAILYYWRKGWV